MYKKYNPNPKAQHAGDCVIRAISKTTDNDWYHTYLDVCIQGYIMADMPSANHVWGAYLQKKGFARYVIPNTCPECYTIADFCEDNPDGEFILATGSHVVAVADGDYYDSWDSGQEVPIYYWMKGEKDGLE